MNDELDRLKKAFEAEGQPLPDEFRRKAAISRTMQAFDEEFAGATQGSAESNRPTNTGGTVFTNFWRRLMTNSQSNLKPLLLGGVSLAVLSFAILNTQHLRQVIPPVSKTETVSGDAVSSTEFKKSTQAEGQISDNRAAEADKPAPVEEQLVRQGKRKNDENAELGIAKYAPATQPASPPVVAKEPAAEREVDDLSLADGRLDADKGAGQKLASELRLKPKNNEVVGGERMKAARRQLAQDGLGMYSNVPSASSQLSFHGSQGRAVVIGEQKLDRVPKQYFEQQGRDRFEDITPNPVKVVRDEPVSTFSIDVDTASYAFMRASINRNVLPQKDAVRVEELINYFPYDYAPPEDRSEPFRTHVSVVPTPWNTNTKLIHIGIKGYELPKTDKPRSNLVFLLDVSGSMNAPNKLPLLRNSFKLLLTTLQPDDTIAIVTYAGRAGTVLEPTEVRDKAKIIAALDQLRSGGSTAGAEGIRQAYQLAEQNFEKDGVNRVILATDGDFNVGITDKEELKSFVERKRQTGVSLSVLGFGMGNYNDELMQTLAQNGNGNAAYIDSLSEARKVLVEEAGSTLFTIAKDVKIQIEFNPQIVSEYRLIGYETRLLKREDFNNDKIDAGDIGAGHSVTAIYEITPVGSGGQLVDGLRYRNDQAKPADAKSDEYAFLKLRYKLPDSDTSTRITTPINRSLEIDGIHAASKDLQFATAVAAFGQLLRGGRYTGSFSYDDVIKLALSGKGDDPFGYRAEFINLVRLAKSAAAMEPLKQ